MKRGPRRSEQSSSADVSLRYRRDARRGGAHDRFKPTAAAAGACGGGEDGERQRRQRHRPRKRRRPRPAGGATVSHVTQAVNR